MSRDIYASGNAANLNAQTNVAVPRSSSLAQTIEASQMDKLKDALSMPNRVSPRNSQLQTLPERV